jgi:hypothetical protein
MKTRKTKLLLIIIIAFTFLSYISYSEDIPVLGIMDIVLREGISESEAGFVSDFVFNSVYKYGKAKYRIISRESRDSILKEQEFGLSVMCDESSCAIKIGKFLQAQYMIFGSCGRFGSFYTVTLQIVDVNTTEVVGTARGKSAELDGLEFATDICVSELFGMKPPAKHPSLGIGIGMLVAGLASAGGGFATYYYSDQYQKDSVGFLNEYNNASGVGPDYTSLWNKYTSAYQTSKALFWTSIGLWAGGAILTGISVYMMLYTEPVPGYAFNIMPTNDGMYLSVRLSY